MRPIDKCYWGLLFATSEALTLGGGGGLSFCFELTELLRLVRPGGDMMSGDVRGDVRGDVSGDVDNADDGGGGAGSGEGVREITDEGADDGGGRGGGLFGDFT